MNDLPAAVEAELLRRWREPHRRYHDERHLRDGLDALDRLGGGRPERIAFWFHDAVHRSTSPADEQESALLARGLLEEVLPSAEIHEIARLVLVTVDHDPEPYDAAGARVSDADLSALALPWGRYLANADRVRAEVTDIEDAAWKRLRLAFIDRLEGRTEIFRTPLGLAQWEAAARRNLARERAVLTNRPATGRSDA